MDGIILTPLKKIYHPKGEILKAIAKSDPLFSEFGEAYFSMINQGDIKGWKKHLEMTLNITCPIGNVRFIFSKDLNEFKEIVLNKENNSRITVKPGIWFAFQGLYDQTSLINNVSDIVHNPKETVRKCIDEVNFTW